MEQYAHETMRVAVRYLGAASQEEPAAGSEWPVSPDALFAPARRVLSLLL